MEELHEIDDSFTATKISIRTLVQAMFTGRLKREHCQEKQTKPIIVSLGGDGRRIPFSRNTNRSTRIGNDDPRKAGTTAHIRNERTESMVLGTMPAALSCLQGNLTLDGRQKNLGYSQVPTPRHCDPHAHTSGPDTRGGTTPRRRNLPATKAGAIGRINSN